MEDKGKYLKIVTNGFLKENPVLRLVLGTCPALAITTAVANGVGMGIAATFVLICSNIAISSLRKFIPDQVRLPCYIVVISGFVTLIHMLVRAFAPALNDALGIYLPLITVNCIILGRAEMFASKNKILNSALDGLGMGIGFLITLVLMSSVREILGAGSFYGIRLLPETVSPVGIIVLPPGGFFVFGVFMALAIFIERKRNKSIPRDIGCSACPASEACQMKGEGN